MSPNGPSCRLILPSLAVASLLAALAVPVSAVVPPQGIHPPGVELRPLEPLLARTGESSVHAVTLSSPSWRGFLTRSGGAWQVRVDARTGRPALVWGSGIPWIPGRGNDLPGRTQPASMEEVRETLRQRALDFLRQHPGLFGVDPGDLVLNPHRSIPTADRRFWNLEFGYAPAGRKVVGAGVFFRLSHGNLVQFGAQHILGRPGSSPEPRLSADQARAVLLAHRGVEEDEVRILGPGRLFYLPRPEGLGLRYRLVWQATFTVPGELPTWTGLVDAHSGELVSFEDANFYACDPAALAQGRVSGGIRPVETLDPEEVRAFPFVRVETTGGDVTTSFSGLYAWDEGPVSSRLGGRYINIECQNCTNPAQPVVQDDLTGDLPFGTGGDNTTGNGTSTVADRTTFWHATMARSLGARWIPDLPFLQNNLRANTNIDATCNAFYNGFAINFFRAGGNCTNSGENPGVIQHEWGHGLHIQGLDYDGSLDPTPGVDGSYSEGAADHVDWIMDRNPRIGPGFNTNGGAVRVVDSDLLGRVRTLSDSGCGSGNGYDGYQVHCGGEIWSQTDWDLTEALTARFGDAVGWFMMERLFYSAIPFSETHVPDQPHSVYDVYALLLDDDGDLANGVPLGDMLNAAYTAHELASTPTVPDSGTDPCDPGPTAPALSATPVLDPTTNEYQVQLSWPAPAGANFLNLVRSENGPDHAFLPLALDLPAGQTMFVDDRVVNGQTYHYRLEVVDANGCVNRNDNTEMVVVDLAELALDNVVLADDSGNGVLVPGEGADLPLELLNLGGAPATAVAAELVALSPGVTVVESTANYPDLPAGGVAPPDPPPFRILVDSDSALCSQELGFRLLMESAEGCWDAGFRIQIGASDSALSTGSWSIDDFALGNASGVADPGETFDLSVDIDNTGSEDAPATLVVLSTTQPGVTILQDTAQYGTVAAGASASPQTPFRIQLESSFPCGESLRFDLIIFSENGCWSGSIEVGTGAFVTRFREDFDLADDWIPGLASDTATTGQWELADPEGTQFQPEQDHTPDPGVRAFVTGPLAGNRGGAFDVDDGCTTLVSPDLALSGFDRPILSYWRWWVNETALDDDFVVDFSTDEGQNWANLETVDRSAFPWQQARFDLVDVVGVVPPSLRLRFVACDEGNGSLTEALIDDLEIGEWVCEAAGPRAELAVTGVQIADNQPGEGNGDGINDPGELIELILELENLRNAQARSIQVSGVASGGSDFAVGSATAADIEGGQSGLTEDPHLLLRLDEFFPSCYGFVPVDLTITYMDDTGPRVVETRIEIEVGAVEPPEVLLADDFEGADDGGWTHSASRGQDDWQRGAPLGQGGDPGSAVSGTNIWGNDLGDGTNGQYPPDTQSVLSSPSFDLAGFARAELRFQRWLQVEGGLFDQARVVVGGQVLWENPPNADFTDDAWTPVLLPLPDSLSLAGPVDVRFELSSDGGKELAGWNLDDFEVRASPTQCTPFCAEPLSTAGGLRVRRTGDELELDWSSLGSEPWIRVYREADPTLLPPAAGAVPVRTVQGGTVSNEGLLRDLPGLTFFRILSVNRCGNEEAP